MFDIPVRSKRVTSQLRVSKDSRASVKRERQNFDAPKHLPFLHPISYPLIRDLRDGVGPNFVWFFGAVEGEMLITNRSQFQGRGRREGR